MLDINRTYFWLFCFMVVGLLVEPVLFKPTDELCLFSFAILGFFDMIYNRRWREYTLFYISLGVMSFYLFYSMLFLSYNIKWAIINDFIIQMKPFIAFSIAYAVSPKFSQKERCILKNVVRVLSICSLLLMLTGLYRYILYHPYYQGLLCVGCGIVYLLVTYEEQNSHKWNKKDILWAVAIFSMGLACTRAKYYGFFVFAMFMLLIYKPGIANLKNMRNMMVLLVVLIGVIVVSWSKIEYYFIKGNADTFDPEVAASFARPVLYGAFFLVLSDHLLFGSGLASFATYFSSADINYSSLYYRYNLDAVWGLSPTFDAFIADTFYPELAQFGLVGIFLFFLFYWWMWQRYRLLLHNGYICLFTIGVLGLLFLMIDSIANCAILQISGELIMVVLGIVVSNTKKINKEC